MRFRSLLIPMLLCVALANRAGPAFAQTEGGAAPPTATTPTPPPEGAATTPAAEQPAAPPPPPAQPAAEQPVAPPPAQPPVEPPVTPPTQPADQGWGTPAGGEQPAWGTPPTAQPAEQGWGAPPVATQPEWGGEPSFELPEDQRLGYWPVVLSLGAGIGGTFEGTVRSHLSAVTVEPSVFIGFLKHWGIHHGPFLSLPVGIPGSYDKTVEGETVTVHYSPSFGIVPGYRLFHMFRRDMYWGFGVGFPMLIAQWQGSLPKKYTFIPGIIEVNAEFGYKFLAGLGVFIKATLQAYQGIYTQMTFGATAGLVIYYEWFRPWEPPAPSNGE